MSTSSPERVSFFRSHYAWILLFGVLAFTSPQWIKALLNWQFDWSSLNEWDSKIGEAAIIGVLVGFFLDRILMASVTSAVDSRGRAIEAAISRHHAGIEASITEIKRDVFLGALGLGIERDIFSLFRQTIVECSVYRDPMRMRITLTREKHRRGDVEEEVLRCDWYEEYTVWGLKSPIAVHEFVVSLSTNDLPFMEDKVGITRMSIGGKVTQGSEQNPFIGKKEAGYSTFEARVEIPHGQSLKIESYSVTYKTLTDSDSFEMVMPTKNLEIDVIVQGCELDVRPHIMSEDGWHTGGRHGLNGNTFHWIPKSAMLPHQGVALQWAPKRPV
jgi:hypothetical protein